MEKAQETTVSSSIVIFICMKRKYSRYNKEDFNAVVARVYSIAELLRELGLVQAGGNYAHACKNLTRFESNTEHWTGQAWSRGKQLKDWTEYARVAPLKKHLIRERGHKCECCKLTVWLGKPIGLEVHHIDANRTNNNPNNLQLLCGNCHQQTPNFRNRS